MAPFDTPGFRNAVIADPQGAVFSVSELRAGAGVTPLETATDHGDGEGGG